MAIVSLAPTARQLGQQACPGSTSLPSLTRSTAPSAIAQSGHGHVEHNRVIAIRTLLVQASPEQCDDAVEVLLVGKRRYPDHAGPWIAVDLRVHSNRAFFRLSHAEEKLA